MAGRPESDEGAWTYDPDAWKEFTPWRPGDPPTEATTAAAVESETERTPGRWWTEERTPRYKEGDHVRNRSAVGSGIFPTVQPGSRGEVVSVRHGILGEDFVTVRFNSGYTEEVRPEQLERRRWLE